MVDELKNCIVEILNMMPSDLCHKLKTWIDNDVQEIRIRLNKPICLMKKSRNIIINDLVVNKSEIEYIFENVCEHSVYAYQDEINNGFITLKNGSRVGICGTAVKEGGRMISVKRISSLNFRVSQDFYGCADSIITKCKRNIIIAGPPTSGKTTMLRDISRTLSKKGMKVCVVDERMELGGTSDEYDLGVMTDCLKGYDKAYGISLAIRTLSPQVIIFDEIGSMDECESVFECLNAGVNVITSVHCYSKQQFLRRPVCKRLIESGFFENVVFLGNEAGRIEFVYEVKGEELCVQAAH